MSFVVADAAFGPRVAAAVIAPSERKLLRLITKATFFSFAMFVVS
jgi:hypothetical protein